MKSVERGTNDIGKKMGIDSVTSQTGDVKIQDETLFHSAYREWLRLMKRGVRKAGMSIKEIEHE